MPTTTHLQSMKRIIESIRYYSAQAVFTDFVEMAAIALRNGIDPIGHAQREAQYLRSITRYEPGDRHVFSELMWLLVEALDACPGDILGDLFMSLGVSNSKQGQFFTPPSISDLLAHLALDPEQLRQEIANRGFVTLSEPSCGAGAMVISFASQMMELGMNYQQHLHVTLVDLDIRAVHMAFIQLSLLQVPAIVVHGNTLTMQEYDAWRTPAHGLGLFGVKLRRGFALESNMGRAHTSGDRSSGREEWETGPLFSNESKTGTQPTQGI